MKQGFVLIELLVATMLLSVAGAGLQRSFIQSFQAKERITESFQKLHPVRKTFMRMERDLRNMVELTEYPFLGRSEELHFPVGFMELDDRGERVMKLYLIRYYVKGRKMLRSIESLPENKSKVKTRVIAEGIREFKLTYPYMDVDGDVTFLNYWLEEPYSGLPRAVRIRITFKYPEEPVYYEKIISIVHGKWGVSHAE